MNTYKSNTCMKEFMRQIINIVWQNSLNTLLTFKTIFVWKKKAQTMWNHSIQISISINN